MKAALYSPYLDTLGGGERYMMTVATVLSLNNINVDVLLDKNLNSIGADYLKNKLSKRFNLDLTKINFIKAPIGPRSDFFSRLFFLKQYDIFFYLTDGSIFLPSAKKNILHIQSPIAGEPSKSLWGKFKLKQWNYIIYNSEFTQQNSLNNWPLKSKVIYPPVDVNKIRPLKKKKYILSVGRFFGYLKDKKHEILIKAFSELYQSGIKEWSLHLVGSAGKGDKDYLDQLRDLANGLPVNFYPNLGYDKLTTLYGESSIYWHAAGFQEDDPTKMEHFGISTVESMSAGAVPVVIKKGGQIEIVEDGKSGFLWNSIEELKEKTTELIKNEKVLKRMSAESIVKARDFSKEKFEDEIKEIIK